MNTPDPEAGERPDVRRAASRDDAPELRARAMIARLCEPDDPVVTRLVGCWGYPELVARLRAGAVPELEGRVAARLERAAGIDDLQIAATLGARVLIPGDPEWPPGVDDLANPPHCLWVRGPGDVRVLTHRSVALVGARAATAYGIDQAAAIAAALAGRGFTVISGAAFGIDAAAHRGALATTGATVAVLACGIDRAYPLAHTDLIAQIARAGAVITELPPGAAPYRQRFLQRNRLIAALGRGTVVIEAALRSGSLQTAARSEELARPVAALPGPVTSMASAGCHQAIRDLRAVLVTDAADIADLIGAYGGADLSPVRRGADRAEDALTPAQFAVWQVLPISGAGISIDTLAERAGVDTMSALAALGPIELAGLARCAQDLWRRDTAG